MLRPRVVDRRHILRAGPSQGIPDPGNWPVRPARIWEAPALHPSYTPAFTARLVQEPKTLAQRAAEPGVHPKLRGSWTATALHGVPSRFARRDSLAAVHATHAQPVQALDAQIGHLTTHVAWLQHHWPRPSAAMSAARWLNGLMAR